MYKLSYNAKGGKFSGNKDTYEQQHNSNKTLTTEAKPTKSGYTFKGWDTSNNATRVVYGSKANITLTKDTILYAVWEAKKATGIDLSTVAKTIKVGDRFTLIGKAIPTDVNNKNVTFNVIEGSSYIEIKKSGNTATIIGKKAGTAKIKVVSQGNSNANKICTVRVEAKEVVVPVKTVSLYPTSKTLKKAETFVLTPTVSPGDASNKKLTYSSNNEKVAKVTQNGKITAVGEGEAKITATSNNGKYATCKIKVTATLSSISLNKKNLEIRTSKTGTITATIQSLSNNNGSINSNITWTTSDNKVATVKQTSSGPKTSTAKITAIKPGPVTITAKDTNGNKAECKVTIVAFANNSLEGEAIEKIEINGTKTISLKANGTKVSSDEMSKYFTFTPDNTTEGKVTVTPEGVVKGINAGDTKIRVKDTTGKNYVDIKVTVTNDKVVTQSSFGMPVGSGFYASQEYGHNGHSGIDITKFGALGSTIKATNYGKVIKVGSHATAGNYIVIEHLVKDGNKTIIVHTYYEHLKTNSATVKKGQYVNKGAKIGEIGSTGNSTGPHLHYEVRTGATAGTVWSGSTAKPREWGAASCPYKNSK